MIRNSAGGVAVGCLMVVVLGAVFFIAGTVSHASDTYMAVCETDHAYWHGPERTTFKAAQADANSHNANVHGGAEVAWVSN